MRIRKESINHVTFPSDTFRDSVAVVTGGTGGIGSVVVSDLRRSGCRVIVASKNQSKYQNLFGNDGEKISWLKLDMSASLKQMESFVNSAAEECGKVPNLWVLSAGVHSSNRFLTFQTASQTDYADVVDIDLVSTCNLISCIANRLIDGGVKGRIVVVSSSTAAEPSWSPYRLAKRGCNGFVRELATPLAEHGIGIWSICPGPCATPMLDFENGMPINLPDTVWGRYVLPDEISSSILGLLRQKRLIGSGQSLFISGGRGTFDIR